MATTAVPLTFIAEIGDPESSRAVFSIIGLLVALGLALTLIAVWLFKSTRPDPELLAPLEMMGVRKWRRADPVWQRRNLDALRPPGATPLEPSAAPPEPDAAFDAGPTASGFDDLAADDATVAQPIGADAGDGTFRSDVGSGEEPVTPVGMDRPAFDEFPTGEIDATMLAAAMAELDEELSSTEHPPVPENGAAGDDEDADDHRQDGPGDSPDPGGEAGASDPSGSETPADERGSGVETVGDGEPGGEGSRPEDDLAVEPGARPVGTPAGGPPEADPPAEND